jgi:Tfp pilus assembly protein PilX
MISYSSRKGMVLIAVLIFLEIFSILGLYALQANLWENKLTQRFWVKNVMDSVAKAELVTAENRLVQSLSNCKIQSTSASILASQDIAWWRSVSCAGIFRMFQYYYVIEFLGNDPCAYLQGADESSASIAGYYRITVLITSSYDPGQKVMLQSSMVKPAMQDRICNSRRHGVTQGRQMMRELI